MWYREVCIKIEGRNRASYELDYSVKCKVPLSQIAR